MATRTTPLYQAHADRGATFTDFGGWEMPVEFDSIRTEHTAVREAVGKFDVSHMGQLVVDGPDAGRLCHRLTTNDIVGLDPGEARYAAITDTDGIMLDDTIVYNLPADWSGEYLVIPNAGHDAEMEARWVDHRNEWSHSATVRNATESLGMIAVQGPDARSLLGPEVGFDLSDLGRFEVTMGTVAGVEALVAATGYTGERGYEIVCAADETDTVWSALECQPVGLGARDTLRIEQGFLLSGQDFDLETEPRNPYEAGIGFAVKLDTEFVGRDALEQVQVEGPTERLTGIRVIDRGIPRAGYTVQTPDGDHLGTVTSGTMSPTLDVGIGLAYLPTGHAEPDTPVRVVVRDEPKKARTTATPFIS